MKKGIYIFLFVVLGVMLSQLLHSLIEIPVLKVLTDNPDTNWGTWRMAHKIGGMILTLLGIIFGYLQGQKWWQIIYVEKSELGVGPKRKAVA